MGCTKSREKEGEGRERQDTIDSKDEKYQDSKHKKSDGGSSKVDGDVGARRKQSYHSGSSHNGSIGSDAASPTSPGRKLSDRCPRCAAVVNREFWSKHRDYHLRVDNLDIDDFDEEEDMAMRQRFVELCLNIKLQAKDPTRLFNFTAAELYAQANEENVPEVEWKAFITHMICPEEEEEEEEVSRIRRSRSRIYSSRSDELSSMSPEARRESGLSDISLEYSRDTYPDSGGVYGGGDRRESSMTIDSYDEEWEEELARQRHRDPVDVYVSSTSSAARHSPSARIGNGGRANRADSENSFGFGRRASAHWRLLNYEDDDEEDAGDDGQSRRLAPPESGGHGKYDGPKFPAIGKPGAFGNPHDGGECPVCESEISPKFWEKHRQHHINRGDGDVNEM